MEHTPVEIRAELDEMLLAQRLAGSIRFPTISYVDHTRMDTAAFHGLQDYLRQEFPLVYQALTWELVGNFSLLFHWAGSDPSLRPALFTGHMDVAPVEEATLKAWSHPPFDGCIEDGFIWGRGTRDDKYTVMGLLEAVEALLRRGFHPTRTLYLAFGEDEEIVMCQQGAPQLAALLKLRGIEPEFVLDEGLVITDGIIPNISKPTAVIGVSEKGFVCMELAVEKIESHFAMPPKETATGILSAAVSRLENHPVPARKDAPAFQTLDALSPEMPIWVRAALRARWITSGMLLKVLSETESTNASIRTTSSCTIFKAGELVNVLPAKAKATVFFFPLPGDSIASIENYVRAVIADPRVQVNVQTEDCAEASPVSPINSPGYRFIEASIRKTFPGVLVVPGIMTTPSDSRHYVGLSKNCYRFSPVWAKPGDIERIHGVDERISIKNYAQVVSFYLDIIQSACGENPKQS